MMIFSRARSIFSALAVISLALSIYFSWALSSKTMEQSPLHMTLIVTAITGFNIAVISGWIGFGTIGGLAFTIGAALFVLLLDLRMRYYGYNIFIMTFFFTGWIGYLFANSKNRLDQLYILRSEKVGEELNVLTNEVKEKNKGIKVFEEKLMRYSILKEVAESMSAALSLDVIGPLIVGKTSKTLGKSGRILLFLVDTEKQELMLSASSGNNSSVVKAKKGDVFDHWVLRHRKPLMVEDTAKDFRFPSDGVESADAESRSLIAAPLVSENKVIGVLRVDSPAEFAYTQDDLRLIDIISTIGAIAIQNSILYSRTQELAVRDSLTGLKVRRFFMESFHREIKRAARKKEQISLLMLDIDNFKKYNDEYGHASGDLVLKYIANTIIKVLDEADIAGRFGGEEITILLWKSGKKEALAKAEEIRKLIKERPLTLRKDAANVTVSIGVSTYPEDAVTEEELIRSADARLYKAKAGGRDKVCCLD